MENKHFTCIGRGHGAPCLPATREEWEQMRREPWLKEMCERIEKGEEELKHRLPVWTPHCAEFKGNHRAIGDALRPLSRLMLDFDEKGHTGDILSQLKVHSSKLRVAGIEVLLVEESVRRGTHVLVELPTGMNADEAQTLMQEVTGFEPDKAVKDVARCIYMVPEDHTKFVSDKLWEPGLSPSPLPVKEGSGQGTKDLSPALSQGEGPSSLGEERGDRRFRGIPYSSIIDEYWNRTGGTPVEGERNVRLHQLAVNLRAICDNKKEVLMQIMPRLGLSETELQSIVESACKEPPKGISRVMREILENEKMRNGENEGEEDEDLSPALSQGEGGKWSMVNGQWSMKKLPIGLKESLVGVPESMHMPVLCAVLPIAAAYADGVEVEYCDGQRHRLGLMSIIRGEQASNKSICKTAVDVWKRQFDQEDALARKREDEWKEQRKRRKANEKAPEDPHVLIRMVPVTVSCSTLLKRLKNAQGHTLYSFGEELDTLRKTNGAGSWSSKYDIYRMGFDHGEWGQDYNSDQAESGVVQVAYNWTMLGTYGAVRRCFKSDNIENGLSSRVLMAEMPDGAFAKLTKFSHRSEADEQRIQEAVTKLRSYSGFIDTPRLRKAIEKWVESKRQEAAKNIDYVMDTYRKRAAVIGFRCGVIHHLLLTHPQPSSVAGSPTLTPNLRCPVKEGSSQGKKLETAEVSTPLPVREVSNQGKKDNTPLPKREGTGVGPESPASLRFAIAIAEYCLEQQMKAFGEALQNQFVSAKDECQRYGANHSIFDQLPPVFSMNDLRTLKRGFCGEEAMRMIISRWKKDGWVEKVDNRHWKKLVTS